MAFNSPMAQGRKAAISRQMGPMDSPAMPPTEEPAAPPGGGPVPVDEIIMALETVGASQVPPEKKEIFSQALSMLRDALGAGQPEAMPPATAEPTPEPA